MDAAVRAVEATSASVTWESMDAGAGAIPKHGAPLPEATLASIRTHRVCFKGPLATPVGGGYRSINVELRQEFELYANLRPVRSFLGLVTRYDKVDLAVVRENTQGEYSGIEHFIDPTKNAAEAISIITRFGCDRIVRFAFEYARAHGRKRVTLVHKANILKMTSGLFLQVGREIAQSYTDVKFDDIIVDNCAMQLVRDPTRFDVIVTTNLFGDILSDLTAGLVGGLGLAPGANIGDNAAIYEAVHGTAPDIAGKGIANPIAAMMAGAMMLGRIGQKERGVRLEAAVRSAIAKGKDLTPDLGGAGTTRTFTDRVIAEIEANPAPAL
jgi:isocitrate dehydrogenase (NAD+)